MEQKRDDRSWLLDEEMVSAVASQLPPLLLLSPSPPPPGPPPPTPPTPTPFPAPPLKPGNLHSVLLSSSHPRL